MDGHAGTRVGVLTLTLLMLIGALSGCDDDFDKVTTGDEALTVNAEMSGEPLVSFDPIDGKTTTVVQFIARDDAGRALAPEDVQVQLLLDGAALDNESLLQQGSEELSASIYLSLVLDASYSMLEHDPPAFQPMLQAARDALVAGIDLYAERAGTFTWNVSWFNSLLFSPTRGGDPWEPDDVLTIPTPSPGTVTKLWAAVEREAIRMRDAYGEIANGPRDHHIMVVFSDGADNYSHWDNATQVQTGATVSQAPYTGTGYRATTLESAIAAIEAHPRLTTHVIGLGSSVKDAELSAIAGAGHGRYFKNLSSSGVGALFEAVTREFATIQDRGATIPLQPGDYTLTVRVWSRDRSDVSQLSFRFHAGDENAGVIE